MLPDVQMTRVFNMIVRNGRDDLVVLWRVNILGSANAISFCLRVAFEERGEDALSARAADEAEAAWVAEMFRSRQFALWIVHFHEQIVGLPMASGKPRWLYQGRRQRQLDATDRHAICGDYRPRAYHQPLQRPPHTPERVGDYLRAKTITFQRCSPHELNSV